MLEHRVQSQVIKFTTHTISITSSINCDLSAINTGYHETKVGIECKNLYGNNLPRISLIRGKLFPDRYLLPENLYGTNLQRIKLIRGKLLLDRYLLPLDCLLISVAFVVFCRVGCL